MLHIMNKLYLHIKLVKNVGLKADSLCGPTTGHVLNHKLPEINIISFII